MVAARQRSLSLSYLTDTLPQSLPPIFDQAQHTTANHRKNIAVLRKIQQSCSTVTEQTAKGVKLVGEKTFNTAFIDMVNRLLPVKKGVAVADRVVKFVAQYVAYTTAQDAASRPEAEEDVETPSSRFVAKLLRHLICGMDAKDKNVRYRVIFLTVSMISGLGEMDDDLYVLLRKSLLDRSRDKESAVRVQAALGLAKLQSGEDENDLEEGQEPLGEVLLDLLRYDPAAEVRRAALYNLPHNPGTLPSILARTRDVDPVLRRTLYHTSLSATFLSDSGVLSITQREEVVRNGLGDREANVRKATAAMLGSWVDQVEGDLLEFLRMFDLLSSQVAEEALVSVLVARPGVLDTIEFNDPFWVDVTPAKAFLVRVFGEHCKLTIKDETRFEEAMPVVTALAFRIQDEYNKLVGSVNDGAEDAAERAFIVGELLKLAVHVDYADETGRRKMFQLTREMISQANIQEELIPRCLDVLSKISDGERDLIRVIVDVVTELREGEGDEEVDGPAPSQASTLGTPGPPKSSALRFDLNDPEARMKAALIDLRCLLICISLLERVHSNLQDNSVFHGLLPDLIIPAVRNKEEPALRDQGLVCLGLCCMIDSKMAANSFGLFVQQLNAADDQLKIKIVQVIFDLLMVQDIQTLVSKSMPADKVIELVRYMLNQDAAEVQAVACEGVAKLMLAGMIEDESILQSLVLLYFSPETADNQPLRQCLTYFLPVYCYSSPENQRRLLLIFSDTFGMLAQLHDELDDEQEMLPLGQMGLMMVDWLDPRKAVDREGVKSDQGVHLNLGIQILKSVLSETTKEVRKAQVSFLGKLNLPEAEDIEVWKIQAVETLLSNIRSKRPFGDAASRNALNRFGTLFRKKYPIQLEGFDEDAFRGEEREEITELFGFIDDIEEMDVDARSEAGSTRKRRSSRRPASMSREPTEVPSELDDATTAAGSSDEDEEEAEDVAPRKKVPPRTRNGRGGRTMQAVEEEEEEDTEEEAADEDVESILNE